jgi:hypothetical protein
MIWPFKRKPKLIDRRQPNDWKAGDWAECVSANWSDPEPGDPEIGDILKVVDVCEYTHTRIGVRCFALIFKALPGGVYEARCFRKLVEQDDAALITRIKSLSKPKERV